MTRITLLLNTMLVVIMGIIGIAYLFILRKKPKHPLPPGPTPWPVLGNLSDMPPRGVPEWEHWVKHRDLYGPISSVTVMGRTLVLVHSADLAAELLEKRSAAYSSRPRMIFGGELCGWNQMMAITPYGSHLRAQRRQMFAVVGTKGPAARFNKLQEEEVLRFLLRAIDEPEKVMEHAKTKAGAIILKITYGYNVEPRKSDPLVALAERANEQFAAATVPGAWLVDMIPALRFLPSWAPGAGFKTKAAVSKKTLMELVERPVQFVRRQMAEGRNAASVASDLIQKADGDKELEQESVIKWTAASLYTAGADTTGNIVANFFLAMMLHPEVQAKARDEIDRVIGPTRLPNFEDRKDLPYVEMVVWETFRWHPVGPLALPHMTTAEDVCEGYLIPAGALVIPNIWWFTHDPEAYPDPNTFNPERYTGSRPNRDPRDFVFGFGRRACPGKLLGDASVWLAIASSLATIDIAKPTDPQTGKAIEPEVRFTPGTISRPVPYKISIKPRSSEYENMIRQKAAALPWEDGHGDEI